MACRLYLKSTLVVCGLPLPRVQVSIGQWLPVRRRGGEGCGSRSCQVLGLSGCLWLAAFCPQPALAVQQSTCLLGAAVSGSILPAEFERLKYFFQGPESSKGTEKEVVLWLEVSLWLDCVRLYFYSLPHEEGKWLGQGLEVGLGPFLTVISVALRGGDLLFRLLT